MKHYEHNLTQLVSRFEEKISRGKVDNISEKSFFQLIEYYELDKEYDLALNVTKLALKKYKHSSLFYYTMARLLFKVNLYAESIDYLEKAEKINPYDINVALLKAEVYRLNGDLLAAIDVVNEIKTLAVKDDYHKIYLCEADIFLDLHKYDKMFYAAKKALLFGVDNPDAHHIFWTATELSRNYLDCRLFLEKFLKKHSYNYLAWYNLGQAYSFYGEYKIAIECMEYSFIINPEFEEGYINAGELCMVLKNYEQAVDIFEEAIEAFDHNSDTVINISECLIYLNRVDEAKQYLKQLIVLDPYDLEAYFLLGQCYAKEGQWYKAIHAFHKMLDLDERYEDVFYNLALAYKAVDDEEKAKYYFGEAISCGPETTQIWLDYVEYLFFLGDLDKCLQVLDEAEEYTYGADLLYCRAAIYYRLGHLEHTIEVLKEALIEDFSMHTILFKMVPELQLHDKILSVITYFENE